MNILFSGLDFAASINWGFIYIADLTKTPSGDVGKILLSYLNRVHIEWFTDILSCDGMIMHINPY
jgi:hypothetical protein